MFMRKMKNVVLFYRKKIASFFLILIGVLFFLSFYSFSPYDRSWFFYNSQINSITNILGSFGANISGLFFYMFGVSSFLLLALIFYLAYVLFRDISFRLEWERLLSLVFIPFVSAAIFNINSISFFRDIFPGGVVGNGLKIITVGWFDPIGAKFFLYSLFSMFLVLIFRSSVTHLLYGFTVVAKFLASKQRFWAPTYRISKNVMHVISIPFAYSYIFCKNLFCGSDVVGKDRSIVTFEEYVLEQEEGKDFQDLENWFGENDLKSKNLFKARRNKQKGVQNTIWEQNKEEDSNQNEKKSSYVLPSNDLFIDFDSSQKDSEQMSEFQERAKILEEKLERFGVFGKVKSIKRGPIITLFEYQPQVDSKISKILSLEDDLALALQAMSIRIIAPIPGRSVVGFEVANKNRKDVLFSSVVKSKEFKNFSGSLPLVLGKDTIGKNVVVDLAKMPHLLIAGSTGSGKSVALNSLLVSMLCKLTPDELNLILIDPKRLEFSAYDNIAHLLFPIVTDPKKVSPILKWVVQHMEERYENMAKVGARNIFDYNSIAQEKLPFIVIVVDELADLMMTSGKEVEGLIARIAQMARAAGIHMIVATQRPSVDVITGLIKVNFPSRISFRVTSKVDSRTILDCCGAEKLLGRGDMLFLGSGSSILRRLHGSYVSSQEIDRIVKHIILEREVNYRDLSQYMQFEDMQLSDADDQLYKDVIEFLETIDEVSISLLQRKFRIGYNRSARIIEKLEAQGMILPSEGGKTRKVVR